MPLAKLKPKIKKSEITSSAFENIRPCASARDVLGRDPRTEVFTGGTRILELSSLPSLQSFAPLK